MTHGADQREAISCERQVQVGEKDVEWPPHDVSKRVAHVRSSHHFKPIALQYFL